MATVKTGISLDRELLDRASALARALHVSRSELFGRAVEDFLKEHENRQILDRLDAMYGAEPEPDDERMLAGMRRLYDRGAERDW